MITDSRPVDSRLAGLVAKLLLAPNVKWRHHAIGLLQAYVVEGETNEHTETRVHVWHPDLRLPDMDDSGLMHDHRFNLGSTVLLGVMHDTEILLHPGDKGWLVPRKRFQVWEIENARSKESSGVGWVKLEDPEQFYTIDTIQHRYSQGSIYSYPKRAFHRSEVDKLTVTLCTKRGQSNQPARLLAEAGKTPRHAFAMEGQRIADPSTDSRCQSLLAEAAGRLTYLSRVG